jgi:uncharacterized protein (TIGR03435 family)
VIQWQPDVEDGYSQDRFLTDLSLCSSEARRTDYHHCGTPQLPWPSARLVALKTLAILARFRSSIRHFSEDEEWKTMTRCSGSATLILWISSALCGQSLRPLAFEAATIKPAVPGKGGGRTSTSGSTVVYNNTTLLNALGKAFGVTSASQITGPAWISENRYDIVAKAPDNTSKEQFSLMLRNLLIERFKLVLHRETRELPAYALVQGSGKLKLVADESNLKNSTVVNGGRREMKSMNMAALAQFATLTLRIPVLDRTGLSGYYDFPYELTREETQQESAPSIFTVISDLGLKLESRKEPFDVIVIDGGDKVPAEN